MPKTNKPITSRRFVTNMVFAALLLVCCVTVASVSLFAWFTSNDQTAHMNGFVIELTDGSSLTLLVSTNGNDWFGANETNLALGGLLSGDAHKKRFYLSLEPSSGGLFSLYFPAFSLPDTSQEVPYISRNQHYYLGSHLAIAHVFVQTEQGFAPFDTYAVGQNVPFLPTAPAARKGQATYVTSPVFSSPRLDILSHFPLADGAPTVLALDVVFVDNEQDQSVYQISDRFISARTIMVERVG